MEDYEFDVYLLCPVRKATKREKRFLEEYKRRLETEKGLKVHYPAKDTDQTDETGGYRICKDHCREIKSSKTAHVYWTGSTGSHVDLGTILAEHFERNMDVILINKATVRRIVEKQRIQGITKSYEAVLLKLDSFANPATRLLSNSKPL